MSNFLHGLVWLSGALVLVPAPARANAGTDLGRLIQQLGSEEFTERDKARQALEKYGEDELPALHAAAKETKDAEVRRGLGEVIASIEARLTREAYAAIAKGGGQVVLEANGKGVTTPPGQLESLSVILANTGFADADLHLLKWLGKVTHLVLTGTKVTDRGLATLERQPSVERLFLDRTAVTDAGLAHLKLLKNLRELDLSDTNVKGKGLECLKNLKRLWVLALDGCELKDQGLASLKALTQVRNLHLSRTRVTDTLIRQLASDEFTAWQEAKQILEKLGDDELPALRQAAKKSDAQVRRCLEGVVASIEARLTKEAYTAIKATGGKVFKYGQEVDGTPLYAVRVDHTSFGDKEVKHLKWLAVPISGLNLSGTKITDRGFAALPAMPKLRELCFNDTVVTDEGLAHLPHLGALEKIELVNMMHTKVKGNGLAHLKGVKSLHQIFLDGCELTDEGLVHLGAMKGLTSLSLRNTRITDKGIASLATLENLTFLGLERTKVTDAALVSLVRLKKLTRLDLEGTRITRQGGVQLRKALPLLEQIVGGDAEFSKAGE